MPTVEEREERRDDRRSRRTRFMLSEALVALMMEKRYEAITVQEIIDRANVGRSTFYAHFLDKEDLFQYETGRLVAALAAHMDHSGANPIIPSLAFLRHVRESQDLIRALVRGRAMEPSIKLIQAHLSRHVEARLSQRLQTTAAPHAPTMPLPVVAQYVAGVLVTLFQWWLDRDMPESPEQLDEYFLQLVRPGVRATTGIEI